jgi:hypothetical protein
MTGRHGESARSGMELQARAARVKERLALSSVIGRAVRLVKSGREHDGLCPFHSDKRMGSFKVNDDKGLYKCFACGATGDHFAFLQHKSGLSFIDALKAMESETGLAQLDFSNPVEAAKWDAEKARRDADAARDNERRQKRAAALWMGGDPIADTPAEAYLVSRKIDLRPLGKMPGALRWRPDIGHPELKGKGPNQNAAMVACIRSIDGMILGVHRTYLDISGWDASARCGVTKLGGVKDAKLTLGPTLGGHIPLWKGANAAPLRDVPPGTDIYMSEGIEDGLSVAMASPSRRVIAGVSLSKLGSVALPPQMGKLVLIGQRDPEGSAAQDALEKAIAAHQEQGRQVSLMMPPPGFKDFNDVLTGKRMAGAQ